MKAFPSICVYSFCGHIHDVYHRLRLSSDVNAREFILSENNSDFLNAILSCIQFRYDQCADRDTNMFPINTLHGIEICTTWTPIVHDEKVSLIFQTQTPIDAAQFLHDQFFVNMVHSS
jgi:hypothetical protein